MNCDNDVLDIAIAMAERINPAIDAMFDESVTRGLTPADVAAALILGLCSICACNIASLEIVTGLTVSPDDLMENITKALNFYRNQGEARVGHA